MRMRWVWGVLAVMLMFVCAMSGGGAARAGGHGVEARKVECAGRRYRYLMYVPETTGRLPVMVLLHGAGDSPEPMVEAWRALATREGIVLVAAELPRDERFEPVAPQVMRCVVEDAKKFATLDASRIYLFGNSMGGYLTYDAALLESQYFAGAAVHAMGIDESYRGIVLKAERKIPVAIYIGDRDPLVKLAGVRETRDLLVENKLPVHYVELKGHDHNYYVVADWVNEDAWRFLKGVRLGE